MIRLKYPIIVVFSLLFLAIFSFSLYQLFFLGKIYPKVYAAGINLGSLSMREAEKLLTEKVIVPENIILKSEEDIFTLPSQNLSFGYDFRQTAVNAYQFSRSDKFLVNIYKKIKYFNKGNTIPLSFAYNEKALAEEILTIEKKLGIYASYPKFVYQKGEITITKGKEGKVIDTDSLKKEIKRNAQNHDFIPIVISFKTIDPTLTPDQVQTAYEKAAKILNKKIILHADEENIILEKQPLFDLIDPKGGLNPQAIDSLIAEVSVKTERPPQNPIFVIDGGKVAEFAPSKDGLTVNKIDFRQKLTEVVSSLETQALETFSFEVPLVRTPSDYKTEDVNNLGIKELIGKGESRFKGSIPSRIHNITLAASKINGIIVKPGEIFSFNKTLGDVSALTGFQQAYIIKDGKTILGDGGGVCQVSTTLFRAALKAGLPIPERRYHAYRVSYYEQDSPPGLDATVFDPTTDLKIKNDTPGHILIQTKLDKNINKLTFEIYGTNDGRVATTSKPAVSDVIPPPEDLYTDDPTLPSGIVKQVDYKAFGAKVIFNYKVEKEGVVIYEKKFVSLYQPWQAKFLRGTGPAN